MNKCKAVEIGCCENKAVKNLNSNSQSNNVLIIDEDEAAVRDMMEILARRGIHATLANDEKDVVTFLDKNNRGLIFIDIKAGKTGDAITLLDKVRTNMLEMPVVMMGPSNIAAHKIAQNAIAAIRAGCCDFLMKPIDRQKVEFILDTFLSNHCKFEYDSSETDSTCSCRMVSRSLKLARIVELAKKIAPTSASVLISGESGTGKELVSMLIHNYSKRSQAPYIRVNCAALSESLLESELFGHEKGAFTGAYIQRKGRFEMAHRGTLLLDEITETPLNFQAKLLRVLEQQDFERVGGNDNIRVNVRIISTTNKDLLQEVAAGRFRQDLYYRLSGVRLIIPPLRDRTEDLPDLIWHFINVYMPQVGRNIIKLDPAMLDIFTRYNWPGNIRQLRNIVLTSLVLGSGSTLCLADVPWVFDEIQPRIQENDKAVDNSQTASSFVGLPLNQVEREVILNTLDFNGGNQAKTAKILGISDRTLRDKVRLYRQQNVLQSA